MALTGVVVMVVGLALVLVGAVMSWRDEQAQRRADDELRGPTAFVGALEKLMVALAKHPVGVRLVALGIVLVFLGGVISGAAGLTA